MKKFLLSILLGVVFVGCAGKPEVAAVPPVPEVNYTIVVKGLETEYYTTIEDAIAEISTYKEHAVTLSKDGVVEIKAVFVDNRKVDKDVYETINNVFQTLSKTVEIKKYTKAINVEVTNY